MIEDVITGMHLGVRQRVTAAGPAPGAPRSPPAPEGRTGSGRSRGAASAERLPQHRAAGQGLNARGMRSGAVLPAPVVVV